MDKEKPPGGGDGLNLAAIIDDRLAYPHTRWGRVMLLSWTEAFAARRRGIASAKFPEKGNARIWRPIFSPRFHIKPGATVFTIGSCFARNIEQKLSNFNVPTLRFSAPKAESSHAANTLLNEYNPGTMAQRIRFALSSSDYPTSTIVETKGGYLDLSLPGGFPVTIERAIRRRQEIADLYSDLIKADVVILTLGLVEAWFDKEDQVFLNQMPPVDVMKASPARYLLERLGPDAALYLLEDAIAPLATKYRKVLITVSPVPLGSTFSGYDAMLANDYSKAVLRTCAQALYDKLPNVDYFPSYEIVRGLGPDAFEADNVHVKIDVVGKITEYMIEQYLAKE
jgi:hypothetical protein